MHRKCTHTHTPQTRLNWVVFTAIPSYYIIHLYSPHFAAVCVGIHLNFDTNYDALTICIYTRIPQPSYYYCCYYYLLYSCNYCHYFVLFVGGRARCDNIIYYVRMSERDRSRVESARVRGRRTMARPPPPVIVPIFLDARTIKNHGKKKKRVGDRVRRPLKISVRFVGTRFFFPLGEYPHERLLHEEKSWIGINEVATRMRAYRGCILYIVLYGCTSDFRGGRRSTVLCINGVNVM